MELWAEEVKSGQKLSVQPGEDKVLHLSQASLGEVKKDKNESVCLFVEVDGKKLVLGTLTPGSLPQQLFDLVFEKDFSLSHNWKNGSVYFYGYKADNPFEGPEDDFSDESDSDEDIPLQAVNNGKQEGQVKQEKAPAAEKAKTVKDSAAGKQKVKIVEPSKEDDSDDDSDDALSEDESDSDVDGDSLGDDDDSDDDEDDSDEEDEITPKKVESSKKRPSDSATKTPVPDKKAKLATPQKIDGKKGGGHVATPHPSKQAGKTPGNKSAQQTPKSTQGSHSCTSCKKNFNSESALNSHNNAKHSAGK